MRLLDVDPGHYCQGWHRRLVWARVVNCTPRSSVEARRLNLDGGAVWFLAVKLGVKQCEEKVGSRREEHGSKWQCG